MASVTYMNLRDGQGCSRCGTMENLTRDHIWPRSKGGCMCDGNFQVLCADCNLAKSHIHDGRTGHHKEDCPEAEYHRFVDKWKVLCKADSPEGAEAVIPEIEAIRVKLAAYKCSPLVILKAHSMVGTVRAWVRDFDKIKASRKKPQPPSLEKLLKTEEKLVEKLAEVREAIARYTQVEVKISG